MIRAKDIDLLRSTEDSKITLETIRHFDNADFIYKTSSELIKIRKELYSKLDQQESRYLDWDKSWEEHPDPSYLYSKDLILMTTICIILSYKHLCKERLRNSLEKEWQINQDRDIVRSMITDNPELTYWELVEQFGDHEYELLLEDLIEQGDIIRVTETVKDKYHAKSERTHWKFTEK